MTYPIGPMALLTSLVLTAGIQDVARRRIPNALTAAVGATGLTAQWLLAGPAAAGLALVTGLLVTASLFWPWMKGKIGGGDVKLLGAFAAWSGPTLLFPCAVVGALAGGVAAVFCFVLSGRQERTEMASNVLAMATKRALPEVPLRSSGRRVSVPYGAAVTFGALLVLWMAGPY